MPVFYFARIRGNIGVCIHRSTVCLAD